MDARFVELTQVFERFKAAFSRTDIETCNSLISRLKVMLTEFPSLPPLFQKSPNAANELMIARDIYEHAVILSVKTEDQDSFERDFFQLKPYYTDTSGLIPPSPQEYQILGLNLLRLLVQNRIAEFHTELELLPASALDNPCMKHAVELEQSFMEGAYNRVLSARQTVPHSTYVYYMDLLAKTVRDEIAGCSEKAYDYLTIADAKQILMFSSEQELLEYITEVNMSIAILPMSAEFKWSPTTVGLIQSSFFWGYLLTQIAGGIWADKFGGKVVLGFGVVWWSLATILTPIAARIGLPCLLIMRAFMGIGEGVAMPAMNNLLSKWIPLSERSRSLALVYSGMYLGSVTGLAISPSLINKFGWPSVFYSFGSLGSIWFALWANKAHSSPSEDPQLRPQEKRLILGSNVAKEPVSSIPWRLILSKAPVWALIVSHFCHNWGTFILLTWMPTYYNQVLKFNLTESGLFCVLPWLTMAVFANIGGWIADTLVSRGLSVTAVRKIMQSIGFLGPAFFLTQLSHINSPALAVLCMACSQGMDAFSQSGLYSNHQDIGPRYAGVLLGLSNTAGVLAGVFGTAATGFILQHGSWKDVFKVAVVLYIIGTLVWNIFSTGEKILD